MDCINGSERATLRTLPRTAYASTVGRMTDATRPFALPAEPTPDDALSAAIRSHLAYRRLTQGDLAEALGVSRTAGVGAAARKVRWSVADWWPSPTGWTCAPPSCWATPREQFYVVVGYLLAIAAGA